VVGFYQVFGIDEPANNYSDIEKCNTISYPTCPPGGGQCHLVSK
jgi:hypothetical protein